MIPSVTPAFPHFRVPTEDQGLAVKVLRGAES